MLLLGLPLLLGLRYPLDERLKAPLPLLAGLDGFLLDLAAALALLCQGRVVDHARRRLFAICLWLIGTVRLVLRLLVFSTVVLLHLLESSRFLWREGGPATRLIRA